MKFHFTILTIFLSLLSFGQRGLGSWNIINVNMGINDKWSVFAEGQLRSLSFYNEYNYYEIKTGANFKVNDNLSLTSGFGSYNTYPSGGNFVLPMQQKEFRTWIQANNKINFNHFTLDHRYRVEQRFTNNGYKNRYRYRLAALAPLNKQKIEPQTIYLSAWSELFFTNKASYFERNRSFVGFGYQVNKNTTLQTGYIYQYDYSVKNQIGRDYFNIAYLYNFDLHQESQNNDLPSTTD